MTSIAPVNNEIEARVLGKCRQYVAWHGVWQWFDGLNDDFIIAIMIAILLPHNVFSKRRDSNLVGLCCVQGARGKCFHFE